MTAVLADPPVAAPVTGTPRRAMLALARVELIRMLRHPVSIAAALLFMGPWLYGQVSGGASRYPVPTDTAVTVQIFGLLLFGGAAMVVANLGVLRAHRHRTDRLYDVLVLPAPWRTGAFLLALLPYGAVVGLLVGIVVGRAALRPGAAGLPHPAEVLTTPVLAVLLGAFGVLLARLVRSAVAAPLAILMVAVASLATMAVVFIEARWRFLLPVVFPDLPFAVPAELSTRPAWRHLMYLAGIVALLAVAALARSGARGRRVVVALVAAAAVTVAGGVAQFVPDDAARRARIAATADPAPMQTCRVRNGVTYCAFGDFTPWIAGWDEVVQGVFALVPATARTGPPPAVRQRVWADGYQVNGSASSAAEETARLTRWAEADAAAGTPEAVTTSTVWGSPRDEAVLAAAVAYRLIAGRAIRDEWLICGARGTILVWLAGQATARSGDGIRELDRYSWGALSFTNVGFNTGISVPDRDAAPGLTLLERSRDEVARTVAEHWSELVAPQTPVERVGELFGVPVPSVPVEERPTCGG
ncbi:ABC transporter [Dactylosporangium fulvum]|uniref:ABC transporter permease n=1 Tax=Dactylosporangium fulvum TaxID=53359 RepID=A0ABY5WAG1_9ACTN|nr:hypothetical protein [Dactylosporangium fulvum]UWP87052.1 hypothetical protein Dfulv_23535 [Dactylosporangium fulvum]